MAQDRKNYDYMENVLQDINDKFITVKKNETTRNNQILKEVIDVLLEKMKQNDSMFKSLFNKIFDGGSFFDGVRVGHPDEYDLHLLLETPDNFEPVLKLSNIPGYVHLNLRKLGTASEKPGAQTLTDQFQRLLDKGNYLDTAKFLSWMESVLQKALNNIPGSTINSYGVKLHKNGPALMLQIKGRGVTIDVDLVGTFILHKEEWPKPKFRSNPVPSKSEFFLVAKQPKDAEERGTVPRYWRLSFQAQERELINSKQRLKPTFRLIKKLRDTQVHQTIKSYYIKNVILNVLDDKSGEFWNNSLSYVFMSVLKEYRDYIQKGKIPYYWNTKENLIGNVNAHNTANIANRLTAIIADIERNTADPRTVAKYLLKDEERLQLK